ncbi:MAG: 5'-methylthioadenosine/S-adenosylhomocysteine nucleosidase [Pseudomonadota bacterium]
MALAAELLDAEPRIAVMSAYQPEWMAFREDLANVKEHTINGSLFLTGELAGKPVVLFLSGVGMVNAAMTTQQAIDHFDIETIVFSGIAGGVDPALDIGDVVVADRWAQYLHSVFARETAEGHTPPPFLETPFANFEMIFPQTIRVTRSGVEEPETKFWFDVDPNLLATAKSIAPNVSLESCAAENECLSDPPELVLGGNGVSGSVFVDNADFRTYVFDTFEAKVLDMESAATAHVAHNNGIPFIAFRSLSDLAGGGEGENEIGTFFGLASTNSAEVVKAFLAAL